MGGAHSQAEACIASPTSLPYVSHGSVPDTTNLHKSYVQQQGTTFDFGAVQVVHFESGDKHDPSVTLRVALNKSWSRLI